MIRVIVFAAISVAGFTSQLHAATVQPFYTQSAAYDFINPPCDSGRQAGSTNCAAAGQALRNGEPFFGGESRSYADLATGVLRAGSQSFGNAQFSPRVDGQANSSSQMFDTLTFHGPIGPNDYMTVTMIADLTHTDAGFQTLPTAPFGVGNAWMRLEGLAGDGSVLARAFACTPATRVCLNNPGYNSGSYEIEVHDNTYTIRGTFRLIDLGTPRTLQLLLALGSESKGFASANADDPILVSLPAGVTFTSASGIFLSAVPLPPSVPLLACAIFSLGAWRRRADF